MESDRKKMQETFDKVARHLLKQNDQARARNSTTCMYRALDGKMCAVGCLIPDGVYRSIYEGNDVRGILEMGDESLGSALGVDIRDPHWQDSEACTLLMALQAVHDGYPTTEWRHRLRNVAKRYHLNEGVIDG